MLVIFSSSMGAAEVATFTLVRTIWGETKEDFPCFHVSRSVFN